MVGCLADDYAIDCPTYPVAAGGSGARGGQWEVYNLGNAVDVMYISPEGHIFEYVEPVNSPGDDLNVRYATDIAAYEIRLQVQSTPHASYVQPSDDNMMTRMPW